MLQFKNNQNNSNTTTNKKSKTSTWWLLMRMAVYEWQVRCKKLRYQADKGVNESKCKSVPLYTLQFCIILDTEFSNMTVNNSNNKKTHFFFKNREWMHRFPEHCKPWGSALSFPSVLSTPVLVAGSARTQLQRNGTWRGRSPPSFTSGLWNSRPARECMLAQQYSQ